MGREELEAVASSLGLEVRGHSVVLYGICRGCRVVCDA